MRVAFLNDLGSGYDADAPYVRPLGGSESAQVYLAVEMARRGHEVHLITGNDSNRLVRGVLCRSISDAGTLKEFDAVVVTNSPRLSNLLRKLLGDGVPVISWEQNTWADPDYTDHLRSLTGPHDYIMCVSEWHRAHYIAAGGLDGERVMVLKNAISPYFENLFASDEPIIPSKMWPPLLAFTSTPIKGLEAALTLFGRLHDSNHRVGLNVFSGFDHYPANNRNRFDERWHGLYERCRTTPGVNYIGCVPQPQLARSLKGSSILFYPSVIQETSSICTMEAMAAGCCVVTTDYGALAETTAGFGELIGLVDGSTLPIDEFVERALGIIERFESADPELERHLRRQVDFVSANYTWAQRAIEFEALVRCMTLA